MKLLLCQNGQAFLDRYESLLLPHEPLYTLILGNARANLQTTACPSCFSAPSMPKTRSPPCFSLATWPPSACYSTVSRPMQRS